MAGSERGLSRGSQRRQTPAPAEMPKPNRRSKPPTPPPCEPILTQHRQTPPPDEKSEAIPLVPICHEQADTKRFAVLPCAFHLVAYVTAYATRWNSHSPPWCQYDATTKLHQTPSTPPTNRPQPTMSPPPTNRPHHEPTDRNATDQPPAKPNRRNQPPTQTDNRLNRVQIRVVARPDHLGTGRNRCFSILRHPNRMRSSASGPGFAAEPITWQLQRLQQP